jgi:hypothetical protein
MLRHNPRLKKALLFLIWIKNVADCLSVSKLYLASRRTLCNVGQQKGGVVEPFPPKPKHMHWSTYLRIRREAREIETKIWGNASTRTARHFGAGP